MGPNSPLVLLVDDVVDNVDMYTQYLAFEGYRVVVARDGGEGVTKARDLQPNIVVMDLSMPVVDGWSATRAIKTDPATNHIPVIVLSAHAMKGAAEGVAAAGADAYLAKPCLPETLEATIRERLAPKSFTAP